MVLIMSATTRPDRRTVFLLAALAGCHTQSARIAIERGPDAVRGDDLRARLRRGMAALGLTSTSEHAPPRAA